MRLVGALGYALVLGGLIALAVRERATFGQALDQVSTGNPVAIAGAFALVIVGYGLLAVAAWTRASQRIARVGGSSAAAAWLGASVAKYVPGFIWHPFSAVERLQRSGATVSSATLVLLVDVAAWIASALLVGAIALPTLLTTERRAAIWLLLSLPAIALLHPKVLALSLHVGARLTGRTMPSVELDWIFVGQIVGLHAAGWLIMGVALSLLLVGLHAAAPLGATVAAVALSWLVGYLFIVAPAGLGVREAMLIALITTAIPLDVAAGAALVWRVMFVSVDVLGFGASLVIQRVARGPDDVPPA